MEQNRRHPNCLGSLWKTGNEQNNAQEKPELILAEYPKIANKNGPEQVWLQINARAAIEQTQPFLCHVI